MEDDRAIGAVWVAGIIGLTVAIFSMGSCVQRTAALVTEREKACVAAGGHWINIDHQICIARR